MLTLDVQLQFIAEEAVARAARDFDARWSGALVVDVPSGDILAWAQYPFFNPNTYRQSSPMIYRNRLASDALEPGSTFKPFVMASALQERKINRNTAIDCENGKWEIKKVTIRDTSRQGVLPAHKVLRYSSNIGMAKIGLELGSPTLYKYLRALGFGESTCVPVADSRGILRQPRSWSEADLMSASFGQSVSVTALQMAQGYLTLLNNGVYKPLRLLREQVNVEQRYERIFSERVCREVMGMMRDVVEEKDGTGKRARIEGVEVAGKTGTAQKADHKAGSYGSKRLASFVGFLPADDPRYLIVVLVDEPTKNQYGAWWPRRCFARSPRVPSPTAAPSFPMRSGRRKRTTSRTRTRGVSAASSFHGWMCPSWPGRTPRPAVRRPCSSPAIWPRLPAGSRTSRARRCATPWNCSPAPGSCRNSRGPARAWSGRARRRARPGPRKGKTSLTFCGSRRGNRESPIRSIARQGAP